MSDVSGFGLIRLVLVTFRPPLAEANTFSGSMGDVTIETLGTGLEDGARELTILMAGELRLPRRPKLAAGRFVVVPPDAREQVERSLETVANLISVFEGTSRVISSPVPCVAFMAYTNEARQWLERAEGIHQLGELQDVPAMTNKVSLDDGLLKALADRFDGVALLAEALAQNHATGRFREFFRLYERAFALPPRKLADPLVAFLDGRYAYSSAEVENWIRLRDPATHADVRPWFALERDVLPFLDRMEQAARDILLNKATWRDPSTTRRHLWEPSAWTESEASRGHAKLGLPATIKATILDEFGAYRTDLRGVWTRLRREWWVPEVQPRTPERSFHVSE
jgi:hypothetical protein